MRGLKLLMWSLFGRFTKSHLLQMRGLKLYLKNKRLCRDKSHLLQMRGLKQQESLEWALKVRSHLLQMRGLKLWEVATMRKLLCRIFYRCVDWNSENLPVRTDGESRIFYRCVDWNLFYVSYWWSDTRSHLLQMRGLKQLLRRQRGLQIAVASFTDAWIETDVIEMVGRKGCRIFYRCVDWNKISGIP